jgi:SAM-dependent methyltransferase
MEPVREAYTEWADEYATLFGSADAIDPEDHDFGAGWAAGRDGRIVDVGCGPGQWTDLLRELGCDVYGVDPVPAFLARARRHYPESTYRFGTAQHLDESDGALAGILAWYSLIHTPPEELGAVFDEFARCLRPGGELLLGFRGATGRALRPRRRHRLLVAGARACGVAGAGRLRHRRDHDPDVRQAAARRGDRQAAARLSHATQGELDPAGRATQPSRRGNSTGSDSLARGRSGR